MYPPQLPTLEPCCDERSDPPFPRAKEVRTHTHTHTQTPAHLLPPARRFKRQLTGTASASHGVTSSRRQVAQGWLRLVRSRRRQLNRRASVAPPQPACPSIGARRQAALPGETTLATRGHEPWPTAEGSRLNLLPTTKSVQQPATATPGKHVSACESTSSILWNRPLSTAPDLEPPGSRKQVFVRNRILAYPQRSSFGICALRRV